jgi:vesicle transport protein SEC22
VLNVAVLDDKAAGLATLSKKYRQDARYLNMKSWYTQLTIGGVVLFMLLLYFRFWW